MKRLLIAVVALAIVLGVMYWPKKAPPPAPPPPTLAKFNPDAVQKIQIDQPAQPPTILTRAGADWHLDQPYAFAADPTSVLSLIGTLGGITGAQDLGPASNAAAFGLDHPSTVTLDLANGSPLVFEFGADSPTGGNTYLRIGDAGNIEMVPNYIKENALKSPFLLQDKKLLHFSPDQLTSLDVSVQGKKLHLERKDNAWPKAQASAVQSLLDALSDGQMTAMPEPSGKGAAKDGLAHPSASLVLAWNGGTARLDLGAKKAAAEYYARNNSSPAIFTVSDYLYTDLANVITPPPASQ